MKILFALGMLAIIKVSYDIYRKWSNKRLVNHLKERSIQLFKETHPERYNDIKFLKGRYQKEMLYSGHLGSIRDGSESDRQENIAQDKLVKDLEEQLRHKVKLAHFEHTVDDVMRDVGCDEKLSLLIINSQSGFYSGTEVTMLDPLDIGFVSFPADRLLKGWKY